MSVAEAVAANHRRKRASSFRFIEKSFGDGRIGWRIPVGADGVGRGRGAPGTTARLKRHCFASRGLSQGRHGAGREASLSAPAKPLAGPTRPPTAASHNPPSVVP